MSADPRIEVVARAMNEWALSLPSERTAITLPSAILAAIDAHAAEVQAKAREGCVPVRAAVGFDANGMWCVLGYSDNPDNAIEVQLSVEGFRPPDAYITAWVRPRRSTEIAGEVEP